MYKTAYADYECVSFQNEFFNRYKIRFPKRYFILRPAFLSKHYITWTTNNNILLVNLYRR